MAENKDKQPFEPNEGKGMTGNDGSKGNLNQKPRPHNDLGNIEEGQQRQSSKEGHVSGGSSNSDDAAGSNPNKGAGSEVEGSKENS